MIFRECKTRLAILIAFDSITQVRSRLTIVFILGDKQNEKFSTSSDKSIIHFIITYNPNYLKNLSVP